MFDGHFFFFVLVGFIAQLVDGALGMAGVLIVVTSLRTIIQTWF